MKTTKTKKSAADADTMRPEYDCSNAVRGVTAARYAQGSICRLPGLYWHGQLEPV